WSIAHTCPLADLASRAPTTLPQSAAPPFRQLGGPRSDGPGEDPDHLLDTWMLRSTRQLSPREEQRRGRPRLKGKRLPTLQQVSTDPATVWTAHTVPQWYGSQPYAVEITSQTA